MNKLKTLKLNRITNLEKKLLDQDLRGYDHYVFIDGNRKAQLITNGKWVTEFIRTAVIKHNALVCEVLHMREEDFSEQELNDLQNKALNSNQRAQVGNGDLSQQQKAHLRAQYYLHSTETRLAHALLKKQP